MVDVSVIIVSFNTREITLQCVSSVIKTTKVFSYEIIVVDNASSDDSVSELKKLAKDNSRIKIIENKENYGFSKANNIGVEKASGRYVLFLNSDTVVYESTIDGMINFMEESPDCGASTCFVRLPNGKLDDAAHRGFPTPARAFSHFSGASKIFKKSKFFAGYNMTYEDLTKTHEIEALTGAFMFTRRSAAEKVALPPDSSKWWDEDFFWYGEDLDFCYRLKEAGWKIYFVPQYEILHYKGVSGGIKKHTRNITTATKETRRRAHNARFAAMRIFYDKHYKNKYPGWMRRLVLSGVSAKKFTAGIGK